MIAGPRFAAAAARRTSTPCGRSRTCGGESLHALQRANLVPDRNHSLGTNVPKTERLAAYSRSAAVGAIRAARAAGIALAIPATMTNAVAASAIVGGSWGCRSKSKEAA